MRVGLVLIVFLSSLVWGSIAQAVGAAGAPCPDAVRRDPPRTVAEAQARLPKPVIRWAERRSRRPIESAEALVAEVEAVAGQHRVTNEGDIEAMAFLVLLHAAKSAQEDLKAIMAQVKAINDAKAQQRKNLAEAQESQAQGSTKSHDGSGALVGGSYGDAPPCRP